MRREDKINQYVNNLEELEKEEIVFTLKDGWVWVHYQASEYSVAERILNSVDIACSLMDDIEMDDDMKMEIFNKWLENIKEHVDQIYKNMNKHD